MFVTTSVMVVLCLSNFFEAYSMVDKPADQMTDSFLEFSIKSNELNSEINKNPDSLEELINLISSDSQSYLFFKVNHMTNGKAVYFNNINFAPKVITGRSFNKKDFENKSNTILISEDVLNNTHKENGKTYYIVENKAYEVIGVYKKSLNKVNLDADYYYNMVASNNLQVHNDLISGLYQLDAAEQTDKIITSLSSFLTIEIFGDNQMNNFFDKIEKTLSTQAINVFPLFLVILMVLLNTFSITTNWIGRRKKEIAIRRLCGATKRDIQKMLFFEYLSITTISFLMGLILAYMISKVSLWIFIGFNFSLTTLFISLTMTTAIGIVSSIILIKQYNNNEINNLMR